MSHTKDNRQKNPVYNYVLCNKCFRPILKDLNPQYMHRYNEQCFKTLCIWCIYQNYKTQSISFQEKLLNKNNKNKEVNMYQNQFQEFKAYMPCCGKLISGMLLQMKQVLTSNCCIHGYSCPQYKKGQQFFYTYDYDLKVGLKCYKQLANKNLQGQSIKTNNDRFILDQLNKLSTEKCSVCEKKSINIVIGEENQINQRACMKCYLEALEKYQLKEDVTSKQIKQEVNQKNKQLKNQQLIITSNIKSIRQSKIEQFKQPKREQIIEKSKILQQQHQQKVTKNPNNCIKCGQSCVITGNRMLTLKKINQSEYCYFCLFKKFQVIKQNKKQNKLSESEYIEKLVKYQEVFSNHCMVCGLNYESMDNKLFVYVIESRPEQKESDLQGSFCGSCNSLLDTDINAYKCLIDLKDLLQKRNLLSRRINMRMNVGLYRQKIVLKINKLKLRLTQYKQQDLATPSFMESKQQPKEDMKLVNTNGSLIKMDDNKKQHQQDQQEQKEQQNKSVSLYKQLPISEDNVDTYVDNNKKSKQQTINSINQQPSTSESNKNQQQHSESYHLDRSPRQNPFAQSQLKAINTRSQLNSANLINIKTSIIDFTQQSTQTNNNKRSITSTQRTQTERSNHSQNLLQFFISNPQTHQIPIQMIQQLNQLIHSQQFINQQNQHLNINKKTQSIHRNQTKLIQQINKNKSFKAQMSHCSNCDQLDYFLSFGSLCQLCFTKYLIGQNINPNKNISQQSLQISKHPLLNKKINNNKQKQYS